MAETATSEKASKLIMLDPEDVVRGFRARQDHANIAELADSIKRNGQYHPILVKKSKKTPGKYIIIMGMRRLRACKKLGIKVEAKVVAPKDEVTTTWMQMEENVHRDQFDKLEIGEGLKKAKEQYDKAHPEAKHGGGGPDRGVTKSFVDTAMKALRCSKSSIYEMLNIAELPDSTKSEINEAKSTKERNAAARKAVREQQRKSQAERTQKKASTPKKKKSKKTSKKPKEIELETEAIVGSNEDIEFGAESCDLVFTDPPKGAAASTKWVARAAKALTKNGQMLVFCSVQDAGVIATAMGAAGLTYRDTIIWHVSNAKADAEKRNEYADTCMAIVWATKSNTYYFEPWRSTSKPPVHNFREGPSVTGKERLEHPDQKPMWLIEDFILRHTKPGDTVLDMFAGVFSISAVCQKNKRSSVGIEKSRKYVGIGKARLGIQ